MTRKQLHQLIDKIPDEKLETVQTFLTTFLECEDDTCGIAQENGQDPLFRFLSSVSGSLVTALFDLTEQAQREDKRLLANRLEYSRRKIFDAWSGYRRATGQ